MGHEFRMIWSILVLGICFPSLLRFEWDMSSTGSCIWTGCPLLVALLRTVMELLGFIYSLVLHPTPAPCFLCVVEMFSLSIWPPCLLHHYGRPTPWSLGQNRTRQNNCSLSRLCCHLITAADVTNIPSLPKKFFQGTHANSVAWDNSDTEVVPDKSIHFLWLC